MNENSKISKIKTLFLKELLYTLRDKHTLIAMIFLPILLYPIISIIGSYMLLYSKVTLERSQIYVETNKPGIFKEILARVKPQHKFTVIKKRNKILKKHYIAVIFPENFSTLIKNLKQANITIIRDKTDIKAVFAEKVTTRILKKFSKLEQKRRRILKGISITLIHPIKIMYKNTATKEKMGGFILGRIVPIIIIVFGALGAFYPAIDLTAGEKERGTLETLLAAPITKDEILYGKFLAVFTVAMLSVAANIISLFVTITYSISFLKEMAGLNISFSFSQIFVIFLLMIPVTVIMSSIMMVIAVYARNFKEAQNYLSPFLIVFILPPVMALMPGLTLNLFTGFIPILNIALLFKLILVGNVPFVPLCITLITTILLAYFSLRFAVKIFNNENILFKIGEDIVSPFKLKKLKKLPGLTTIFLSYSSLFLLLYYAGGYLQYLYGRAGVFYTQLIIGFFTLILLKIYGIVPEKLCKFHMPDFKSFVFALCLMIVFGLIAHILFSIQNELFPAPKKEINQLKSILKTKSKSELLYCLFIFAIVPGICEELFFRGFILRLLIFNNIKVRNAIFISAVFFGLFHISPYRFIPTTVLGLALCIIAYKTDSILPCFFAHILNNAVTILFLNFESSLKLIYFRYSILILLSGIFILIVSIIFVRKYLKTTTTLQSLNKVSLFNA